MKKKTLNKSMDSLLMSLNKNLDKYASKGKQKNIHNLRVDIKALRAIYSFLIRYNDQKHLSERPFIQLFDESGKLRELYLNTTRLKSLSIKGNGVPFYKDDLIKLKAEFIQKVPEYIEQVNKIKNEISLHRMTYSFGSVRKYYKKNIKKCIILLSHPKNLDDLHRFRIRIKKMMYLYQVLPKNYKKKIGLNETYIFQLQELIGMWHDTVNAIAFIEQLGPEFEDYRQKLNHKVRKQYFKVIKRLETFKKSCCNKSIALNLKSNNESPKWTIKDLWKLKGEPMTFHLTL